MRSADCLLKHLHPAPHGWCLSCPPANAHGRPKNFPLVEPRSDSRKREFKQGRIRKPQQDRDQRRGKNDPHIPRRRLQVLRRRANERLECHSRDDKRINQWPTPAATPKHCTIGKGEANAQSPENDNYRDSSRSRKPKWRIHPQRQQSHGNSCGNAKRQSCNDPRHQSRHQIPERDPGSVSSNARSATPHGKNECYRNNENHVMQVCCRTR